MDLFHDIGLVAVEERKEGDDFYAGFLRRFQQLRSYSDEMEPWNQDEIPCFIKKFYQLQKHHRQHFTKPLIYIVARLTH